MVNIDTVYQRVLVLANKEQRGYITPQEFSLFSNQAQKEIFEQYFYDLNQFQRVPGNGTVFADVDDMLEEKLQVFETVATPLDIANYASGQTPNQKRLPSNFYRLKSVKLNSVDAEIMRTKDFENILTAPPLLRPTASRPVANLSGNILSVVGGQSGFELPTNITYFRIPVKVSWGYVLINEKPLYDANTSKTTHFELHPSEETELVYKILKFAGVAIQRDDIMRAGQGMELAQVQLEKK
jgi:hypothetical protein